MFCKLVVTVTGLLLLTFFQQSAAQSYRYRTINLSSSGSTNLTGVNLSGQVLGALTSSYRCILIAGGSRTPVYNGHNEYCSGINGHGVVVGTYYPRPHTDGTGFVYQNGKFTDVILPDGNTQTSVGGISDSGMMTGSYYDQTSSVHGFVFDGKSFQTIDVPGATMTAGTGINNAGQVALFTLDSSDTAHSYLKVGNTLKELVFPGAISTYSGAINNKGQVALCIGDSSGHMLHGGVYDSAKDVYYRIDYPGRLGTCVQGISDKQTLVGSYSDPKMPARQEGFIAIGALP